MNILFKINQLFLISVFFIIILILIFVLYFQLKDKTSENVIEYKTEVDVINPRFIKEKSVEPPNPTAWVAISASIKGTLH